MICARRRASIEATRARSAELFGDLLDADASDAVREAARDALVQLHLPLVEHCARRFRNRGEPFEDLVGGAEGGAEREALAVLAGQLRERGQRPLGGELGRPGEMQGA